MHFRKIRENRSLRPILGTKVIHGSSTVNVFNRETVSLRINTREIKTQSHSPCSRGILHICILEEMDA